jgi:PAS domain S-box-containing protein
MPCDKDKIGCDVFANLTSSVLVIDKDFNILAVNKSAGRLMECDEVIGKRCYTLTHKSDKPCWENGQLCPVKECLNTKEFTQVVHKRFHDGVEVFEEISATPVLDENGDVKYVIEELRDISKLLKLETVINSLRSEIKTLQGILPICASCKKVRDDEGYWSEVENYIASRTEAVFSHSICPSCLKDLS